MTTFGCPKGYLRPPMAERGKSLGWVGALLLGGLEPPRKPELHIIIPTTGIFLRVGVLRPKCLLGMAQGRGDRFGGSSIGLGGFG